MRNRILAALAALALTAAVAAESRAHSGKSPDKGPDKGAIEAVVRDYLLRNPEVIGEALDLLQAKQEAEERKRAEAAIRENGEALRSNPMSPVSGNANGDVTVVEFFDYQCGYCKRALPTMEALLITDPNVRVVWKEFPILGPVSLFAARTSMAADRQGRYLRFHVALMREPKLTEDKVLEIAVKAGLDLERLRQDMEDPAIGAYIDETRALAQSLGIRGTPAFLIGETLIPGAIDTARMKELIATARAGGNRG